jgi:CheY-like chemotaxis protein
MAKFMTLLVEDDEFQREVLADVLRDEGMEVIECTTAESAELIVASTGAELQALITDHNLAGDMPGVALAHYARHRHPDMNIVIMSGRAVPPMPIAYGTQTMTETTVLTRALVDLCTMTGRLDAGIWAGFKTADAVEPQQVEPVLVEVIGHLCTLAGELQREMDRLSIAPALRP